MYTYIYIVYIHIHIKDALPWDLKGFFKGCPYSPQLLGKAMSQAWRIRKAP